MAKRRAEALALGGAPCPRFLRLPPHAPLPKRSRREPLEPPLWSARCWLGGGGQKRKRGEGMEPSGRGGGGGRGDNNNNGDQEGDEGDEGAVNGKRPAAAAAAAAEESAEEKGQAFPLKLVELPSHGAEEEEEKAASLGSSPTLENEDDDWRYNSFQYWRSPLPTIHLSDILDLENNQAVDERESSSIGMSEMET